MTAASLRSVQRARGWILSLARHVVVLCLVAALSSCGPDGWDGTARQELLNRVAADQAIRDSFTAALRESGMLDSALAARMAAIDSANTAWFKTEVARRGWPLAETADDSVPQAAFLIVQHASHESAFQEEMLELLQPMARSGQVSGQGVAYLADRVAVHRGRPQVYGTQASIRDGKVILDPIEDSSGVDARRAELGLPPLADYVRILDSVYGKQPQPPPQQP